MYLELAEFVRRPEPFSRYTTDRLWTDPHVARSMLAFHLDESHDLASRSGATIDGFVGWLDAHLGLSGKRVLDLGCGPGLYTTRMARRGALVTGLDFSAVSLNHARSAAVASGHAIEYLQADYHRDPLPGPVDVVTLIYGDYNPMSPDLRRRFLGKVREVLAPGGAFVFDVFSRGQFDQFSGGLEFGHRFMHGFWAEGDYFGFKVSHRFDDQAISLDRYRICRPDQEYEIFNWIQYFDPAELAAELAESGFAFDAPLNIVSGAPWQPGPSPFAVIARPI